jgi:hypothetical protein
MNFHNYIDFLNVVEVLEKQQQDFELKFTAYTCQLKYKNRKYLFADSICKNKFFSVTNAIKKEIKETGEIFESVKLHPVQYFRHNLQNSENFKLDKCYGIDIKKAYPTTLFNERLISRDTFYNLCKLPKYERLKAVGTLATQIQRIIYRSGIVIQSKFEFEENFRNCFFKISKIVGDTMLTCREIAGDEFLFFWVDCIVLKSENKINEICEYLKSISYLWEIENYTDFNVTKINNAIHINCKKNQIDKIYKLPINQISNFKKLQTLLNN